MEESFFVDLVVGGRDGFKMIQVHYIYGVLISVIITL